MIKDKAPAEDALVSHRIAEERILVDRMTSDRTLKAFREGSKGRIHAQDLTIHDVKPITYNIISRIVCAPSRTTRLRSRSNSTSSLHGMCTGHHDVWYESAVPTTKIFIPIRKKGVPEGSSQTRLFYPLDFYWGQSESGDMRDQSAVQKGFCTERISPQSYMKS